MASFWQKIFYDKNGRPVITEKPNAPIIIWFVALILSLVLPQGNTWQEVSLVVATVSLVLWAVLELVSGVNIFRRVLGASVLIIVIVLQFV